MTIQIQKVAIFNSDRKKINLDQINHLDIKTYSHRLFFDAILYKVDIS